MSRKPSSWKRAGIALLATLVVVGCTSSPDGAPPAGGLKEMAPITLKYSDGGPETGSQALAVKAFAEEITEKTDGR